MATMDDLIETIAERPDPVAAGQQFTDVDDQVFLLVSLPADRWVEILNAAKDESEVDGASAVYSAIMMEEDDPHDIGDIEIANCMHARAGRLALNVRMIDVRATQLLAALPGGNLILRLQFLRENDDNWVLEGKFNPVRTERKKGQGVIEISRDTKPGVLTGIDSVFYQNAYPVTAVAYGLYPIRDPDPANLAPLRDGDLNCVAQRVVEHFEGAQRGQGLTFTRRQKIQGWEERVRESGATVDDVVELEKVLKRAIVLRKLNSGKYQRVGNGVRGKVELIVHNDHALTKDFP